MISVRRVAKGICSIHSAHLTPLSVDDSCFSCHPYISDLDHAVVHTLVLTSTVNERKVSWVDSHAEEGQATGTGHQKSQLGRAVESDIPQRRIGSLALRGADQRGGRRVHEEWVTVHGAGAVLGLVAHHLHAARRRRHRQCKLGRREDVPVAVTRSPVLWLAVLAAGEVGSVSRNGAGDGVKGLGRRALRDARGLRPGRGKGIEVPVLLWRNLLQIGAVGEHLTAVLGQVLNSFAGLGKPAVHVRMDGLNRRGKRMREEAVSSLGVLRRYVGGAIARQLRRVIRKRSIVGVRRLRDVGELSPVHVTAAVHMMSVGRSKDQTMTVAIVEDLGLFDLLNRTPDVGLGIGANMHRKTVPRRHRRAGRGGDLALRGGVRMSVGQGAGRGGGNDARSACGDAISSEGEVLEHLRARDVNVTSRHDACNLLVNWPSSRQESDGKPTIRIDCSGVW